MRFRGISTRLWFSPDRLAFTAFEKPVCRFADDWRLDEADFLDGKHDYPLD